MVMVRAGVVAVVVGGVAGVAYGEERVSDAVRGSCVRRNSGELENALAPLVSASMPHCSMPPS